jgi:hypothetical protein
MFVDGKSDPARRRQKDLMLSTCRWRHGLNQLWSGRWAGGTAAGTHPPPLPSRRPHHSNPRRPIPVADRRTTDLVSRIPEQKSTHVVYQFPRLRKMGSASPAVSQRQFLVQTGPQVPAVMSPTIPSSGCYDILLRNLYPVPWQRLFVP